METTHNDGAAVKFIEGIKRPAGTFIVEGAPHMDNDGPVPRPYLWLILAEDIGKAPSRQRRRSGYADELEPATVEGE